MDYAPTGSTASEDRKKISTGQNAHYISGASSNGLAPAATDLNGYFWWINSPEVNGENTSVKQAAAQEVSSFSYSELELDAVITRVIKLGRKELNP